MTIAVNRNLMICKNSQKKVFRGFNGIRTRALCVRAAVLSQLSYKLRPMHWRLANLLSSNPVEAPKNFFSGYFRSCLNCDSLRWSHAHFIRIPAVHIISFSVSFLSRVDELNKLASLQCMGVYSSAGGALQRERRGHGFESRYSPDKTFFRAIFSIA